MFIKTRNWPIYGYWKVCEFAWPIRVFRYIYLHTTRTVIFAHIRFDITSFYLCKSINVHLRYQSKSWKSSTAELIDVWRKVDCWAHNRQPRCQQSNTTYNASKSAKIPVEKIWAFQQTFAAVAYEDGHNSIANQAPEHQRFNVKGKSVDWNVPEFGICYPISQDEGSDRKEEWKVRSYRQDGAQYRPAAYNKPCFLRRLFLSKNLLQGFDLVLLFSPDSLFDFCFIFLIDF